MNLSDPRSNDTIKMTEMTMTEEMMREWIQSQMGGGSGTAKKGVVPATEGMGHSWD